MYHNHFEPAIACNLHPVFTFSQYTDERGFLIAWRHTQTHPSHNLPPQIRTNDWFLAVKNKTWDKNHSIPIKGSSFPFGILTLLAGFLMSWNQPESLQSSVIFGGHSKGWISESGNMGWKTPKMYEIWEWDELPIKWWEKMWKIIKSCNLLAGLPTPKTSTGYSFFKVHWWTCVCLVVVSRAHLWNGGTFQQSVRWFYFYFNKTTLKAPFQTGANSFYLGFLRPCCDDLGRNHWTTCTAKSLLPQHFEAFKVYPATWSSM